MYYLSSCLYGELRNDGAREGRLNICHLLDVFVSTFCCVDVGLHSVLACHTVL